MKQWQKKIWMICCQCLVVKILRWVSSQRMHDWIFRMNFNAFVQNFHSTLDLYLSLYVWDNFVWNVYHDWFKSSHIFSIVYTSSVFFCFFNRIVLLIVSSVKLQEAVYYWVIISVVAITLNMLCSTLITRKHKSWDTWNV